MTKKKDTPTTPTNEVTTLVFEDTLTELNEDANKNIWEEVEQYLNLYDDDHKPIGVSLTNVTKLKDPNKDTYSK